VREHGLLWNGAVKASNWWHHADRTSEEREQYRTRVLKAYYDMLTGIFGVELKWPEDVLKEFRQP